jgi:ribose 5-phosphate isomerase A
MSDEADLSKKSAGYAAADHVENGMTLGIGTGSTARYFIDAIGEKIKNGWRLRGVPTSEETRGLAEAAGVEIIIPDETTSLDLAVDGADEADSALNLIKGGGGALLREKIVARAAKKFIVIADKSKRVARLGAFPLPVEIEPFGWALTVRAVRAALGQAGVENMNINLRARDGAPFQTDGGHLTIDCACGGISDPAALEDLLGSIPGVVESGLFCGMADLAIFGDGDAVSVVNP